MASTTQKERESGCVQAHPELGFEPFLDYMDQNNLKIGVDPSYFIQKDSDNLPPSLSGSIVLFNNTIKRYIVRLLGGPVRRGKPGRNIKAVSLLPDNSVLSAVDTTIITPVSNSFAVQPVYTVMDNLAGMSHLEAFTANSLQVFNSTADLELQESAGSTMLRLVTAGTAPRPNNGFVRIRKPDRFDAVTILVWKNKKIIRAFKMESMDTFLEFTWRNKYKVQLCSQYSQNKSLELVTEQIMKPGELGVIYKHSGRGQVQIGTTGSDGLVKIPSRHDVDVLKAGLSEDVENYQY